MSVLRVQSITDEAGTGAVEFTKGLTYTGSLADTQLSINNASGISTFVHVNSNAINVVGVMTASFAGDASRVTNPPGLPIGKAIATHLVIT